MAERGSSPAAARRGGDRRTTGASARRLALTAGMASYLDSGALVASGLAIGAFYAERFDLSDTDVGLMLGGQTLAFAAGAVVGGRLGDRVGRRAVLVASLGLYVVGVGLLAFAWAPVALMLGVLLAGLAIGGDLPTSLALISEEAPEGRRGQLVVVSQMLWVTGIAVTGLLAFVVAPLGVLAARILYLHLLVVALVVLMLRLGLRESREWRRARRAAVHQPRDCHGGPSVAAAWRTSTNGSWMPAALALGAYYMLWNLGANTIGQFRPFLWLNVMDGGERGASALVLIGVPLGLLGGWLFLKVVDTPRRGSWIAWGSWVSAVGWAAVALSPTPTAFVVLVVTFVAGAAVSGETAYKVWAQELVPTLVRATVQGATMAVARVVAALFALVTPVLATTSPRALFCGILCAHLIATAIALRWVPRLSRGDGRDRAPKQFGP